MRWPGRSGSIPAFRRWICSPSLAWTSSAPDEQRFPCLRLARQAAEAGGSAPAMLNAANEVAVAAFLERRIRFTDIAVIIEDVLNREVRTPVESLDAVLMADRRARGAAQAWLTRHAG